MTRASIIIAAYNAETSIATAIASAQQQSERDIEILVIDDASTDATVAEAKRLAAADPRIRLLSAGRNAGPGAARNFGLDHARGEWVAVLDADDRYRPERIATLCTLGVRTGADLVADNLLLCPENAPDGDGLLIPREKLAEGRWLGAVEFVVGNLGDGSRARRSFGFLKPVIRRDFLERSGLRYDETRFSEDFLFCVKCLLRGASWFITPMAMYYYTVRASSLSARISETDLAYLSTTERELVRQATALDPALATAIRRHRRTVNDALCWLRFVRALKRRDWRTARGAMLHDRRSFVHVCHQGLRAVPRAARLSLQALYERAPW